MQMIGKIQSINAAHHHEIRPFCACCGGGDKRKGYTYGKAKSRRKNNKARKPRHKDHH